MKRLHRIELRTGLVAMCTVVSLLTGFVVAKPGPLEPGQDNLLSVARDFDQSTNETTVFVITNPLRILAGLLASVPESGSRPNHQTIGFTLNDVSYTYPGKTPRRPETVKFGFISDGRKPKFSDNLDFSIEAEATALHQGKIDYSLRDSDDGKIEVLTVTVPTAVFLRMTKAKKVHWTLGTKQYNSTDTQRKAMRLLAETIP